MPFCVRIKAKGPQGVCVWYDTIRYKVGYKFGSKVMTFLHHHPCSNESKILIWKEIKGLAHDVSYLLLHCKQLISVGPPCLPPSLTPSLSHNPFFFFFFFFCLITFIREKMSPWPVCLLHKPCKPCMSE